ncbi:MAG: DUF1292 domain-containing protein [Christensenellales bacterium]
MADTEEAMVVELIDEDGTAYKFEHILTFQHEDEEYIALLPVEQVPDVEDDEIMIMKVERDGDEDTYTPVGSREKLDEVFDTFLQIMEELDEEEGQDEE